MVKKRRIVNKLTELLGIGIGLALLVGTLVFLNAQRSDDTTADPNTGCDGAVTPDEPCDPVALDQTDTRDGAIARFIAGTSWSTDTQYLLLTENDWDTVVKNIVGTATLQPGGEIIEYAAITAALNGNTLQSSWQQEWHLQTGGVLVEQIFKLETEINAQQFVTRWGNFATSSGLLPLDSPTFDNTFPGETLGTTHYATTFANPEATGTFANRRCGAQILGSFGAIVLVETFYTGGDCSTVQPAIPASILKAVGARIMEIYPNQ